MAFFNNVVYESTKYVTIRATEVDIGLPRRRKNQNNNRKNQSILKYPAGLYGHMVAIYYNPSATTPMPHSIEIPYRPGKVGIFASHKIFLRFSKTREAQILVFVFNLSSSIYLGLNNDDSFLYPVMNTAFRALVNATYNNERSFCKKFCLSISFSCAERIDSEGTIPSQTETKIT